MAHVEAFVEAGFGSVGMQCSQRFGRYEVADQFAVERMKTNGMRQRTRKRVWLTPT